MIREGFFWLACLQAAAAFGQSGSPGGFWYADQWCKTRAVLDHTCIQNAIRAAAASPSRSGTVYIRAGTYTATASINLASNVSILCSRNWKTQINFVDDGSASMRKFTGGSPGATGQGISSVSITGCSIAMTGVTGRTGVYGLISFFNSNHFHILRNQLGAILGRNTNNSSSSTCIFVSSSSFFEVAENTCDGTQADGFHISRGSTNFSIHDNWFKYNGDDSIALISVVTDDGTHKYPAVSDGLVVGNHIDYNGGVTGGLSPKTSGISCMGCVRTEIANNKINDPAGACVTVSAVAEKANGSFTHRPFQNNVHDNTCIGEHRIR